MVELIFAGLWIEAQARSKFSNWKKNERDQYSPIRTEQTSLITEVFVIVANLKFCL